MLTLQLPIPYVAANKTAISCTIGAHTPAILPGCHKAYLGGSWLPEKSSCALTVHMRPTVITLNYSVKNLWNNLQQIIVYTYTNNQQFTLYMPTSCLLVSEKSSVLPPHMKTLSPMATEAWPHLGRGSYLFSSGGRSIVCHLQIPDCTGLAQEGNLEYRKWQGDTTNSTDTIILRTKSA